MPLQLGDTVPDFTQQSTEGDINLYQYAGSNWVILFSHPKDFTPVCTTELGAVAKLKPEFEKRGVKVLGLSVDSLESHEGWVGDIEETQGVKLNFPLIADHDRKVANLYEMIHPNEDNVFTVRSVFIIDPNKKLRLMLTYPAPTGRNFNEILRAVDSLLLTDKHKLATPVNWKQGDEVIILPSVTDEVAKEMFPDGWRAEKPYLRYTKQPE
ncbi:MAG TPA: peroxiredoxin [Fimbriimonadaceae bacterium]|nr:peroxiredoxin [Fimbriimonadaceae bacterium]